MNEKTKVTWNEYSDTYYRRIYTDRVMGIIESDPKRVFPGAVYAMLRGRFPDMRGLRVCVPSSGDNMAVFGFHLLGAKVTSADISERQLCNARRIAEGHGWDIEFICEDNLDFGRVQSGEYDLVYTSNGAHVWIADLPLMYRNFNRVLKAGGAYIMFETHPFVRPFDDSGPEIKVKKPYSHTGPFVDDESGASEFAWRIQDIANGVIEAGYELKRMTEFHSEAGDLDSWWYKSLEEGEADNQQKHDWTKNPWAALPQWIGLHAEKHG